MPIVISRLLLPAAVAASLLTGWTSARAEAAAAGFGATSCSLYLNELNGKVRAPSDADDYYFASAQGFMSALNLMAQLNSQKVTDLLPRNFLLDAQKAFLLSWCHQNPQRPYEAATLALYTWMRERQGLPQFIPPPRPSTPSETRP
jgi:hypothetical protein